MISLDIVNKLGGEIKGIAERVVGFPCTIDDPKKNGITFLGNKLYKKFLKGAESLTIIINSNDYIEDLEKENTVILVDEPQLYFGKVLSLFEQKEINPFISEFSFIDKNVIIGKGCTIYPHSYIGKNVKIDDKVVIYPNVTIMDDANIGMGTKIFPSVFIGNRVSIGENCYIDSGAKIGTSGFGFPRSKDGKIERIPQIGSVKIGNNVYIGANTTIDRGAIENTIIGDNTKIDTLVQIAHNLKVGKECLIISQSGIAGSTKIGDYVTIAAQVGIVGHLTIGDGAIVGAKSGVSKSIPKGEIYSGIPARPHYDELRKEVVINKLPEMYKKLKELEKHGRE
jgi:UDP-3-O-[3-hydroxymyristoyl] glucosamine N-acyltransferase